MLYWGQYGCFAGGSFDLSSLVEACCGFESKIDYFNCYTLAYYCFSHLVDCIASNLIRYCKKRRLILSSYWDSFISPAKESFSAANDYQEQLNQPLVVLFVMLDQDQMTFTSMRYSSRQL